MKINLQPALVLTTSISVLPSWSLLSPIRKTAFLEVTGTEEGSRVLFPGSHRGQVPHFHGLSMCQILTC